jgi:tetratricopeptide (TPR) repeat protein
MSLREPFSVVLLAVLYVCSALAVAQQRTPSRDELILQIQSFINNHDLEHAQRTLQDAAKRFPADSGFANLRGVVAAEENDFATAESSFNEAIRLAPTFAAAYLNLGRLYQERSGSDSEASRKALGVYERVLRFDPKNPEANYQSAVSLMRTGQYRDSLSKLSRLPLEVQNHPQQLSIACADYAALRDRTHADQASTGLLKSADFSEADADEVVPTLVTAKRDDLIVAFLEKLQTRGELSPPALRDLGLAYERQGRFPEARAAMEKFVATGNLSVPSLLVLAKIAREQQDYQGALGYLAHARDLDPANANIHYFFGVVALDLNLIAEARNSFEKAVKVEPENPSYNYAMGAASAFQHDPSEAVPYFEKYLKLKPEDPRGKIALGVALFRAKDFEGAISWLTEAVKIPQTATKAHYYLGAIYVEKHQLDDARRELRLALHTNPDYADALAELGRCDFLEKNYSQAESEIQQALKIDPDHLSANFYLLNVYIRTKDPRREEQSKRFDELQKLHDQKTQEFLRIVEVRPR